MALALPVPSYGKRDLLDEKISRFSSAPPDVQYLRKMLKPLQDDEFKQIKNSAKKSFKLELERCRTSNTWYNGQYDEKILNELTVSRTRPTSSSRKNNPHPPEVFLVNRLRSVPGYYQPEKAGTQKDSNGDSFMTPATCKRPYTAHTTLRQRMHMQDILGKVPAQAAEAWIKLSPEKDRISIRQSFAMPKNSLTQEKGKLAHLRSPEKANKESVEWLQQRGYSKNESLQRLSMSMQKAPPTWWKRASEKAAATKNAPYKNTEAFKRVKFDDFQIHPHWHMAWHKQYDCRAPRHPPQIYA